MRTGLAIAAIPGGVRATGLKGLDGWSVEANAETGAVTLTPAQGQTVTPDAWRKVPVATIVRAAQRVRNGDLLALLLASIAASGGDPRLSSRGGKRDHLERVAAIYRLALQHDLLPATVLHKVFGTVSERTPQHWIAEARKAHLLRSYSDEKLRHADPDSVRRYTENRTGKPMTDDDVRDLLALLNSPGRKKAVGRSPGRGSTMTTTKKGTKE
jgi:hypothetical protein